MQVKTSELIDCALDWAVAKALGHIPRIQRDFVTLSPIVRGTDWDHAEEYSPSTNWSQGGPIVEREIGNLWKHNKLDPNEPDVWTAAAYLKAPDGTMLYYEDGPTPLIAAMRCYCRSKLGDVVDIPEELCQQQKS